MCRASPATISSLSAWADVFSHGRRPPVAPPTRLGLSRHRPRVTARGEIPHRRCTAMSPWLLAPPGRLLHEFVIAHVRAEHQALYTDEEVVPRREVELSS